VKVIPAVDIKGGQCVQLVGGKPGTEKVRIDDVVGVARQWQADGAEIIHVIDLDAALGTGDNETLIEKVVGSVDVPVQVGGGIRTQEQAERFFDIGCERVIVGTRAIQDRTFVSDLARTYEDGIVVAIDSVQDRVMVKGWQLRGIDPVPVKALVETTSKPVIVSGGITTDDDLITLQRLGAHSAVLGMAIYTGKIDFRKAVREFA
jgi:phosphoribosylformimino-5-aminoimidazole carboxamide ribotide isomerase